MSFSVSRQEFWIGCALAIISAISFGLQAVLAKSLYGQGMDIYSFMALTRLVQCFGTGLILYFMGRQLWTGIQNYRPIAMLSLIFLSFSWLHYSAIQYLDIAPVTMLVFLYPLILAGLHIWIDKTQLTRAFLLSLLTALVGLALVIQPDKIMQSNFNWIGAVMAAAAGFLIATYLYLSGKVLQSKDPFIFTVQVSFIPAIVFATLSIANGVALPPVENIAAWGVMAISLFLHWWAKFVFSLRSKK